MQRIWGLALSDLSFAFLSAVVEKWR